MRNDSVTGCPGSIRTHYDCSDVDTPHVTMAGKRAHNTKSASNVH
jgi:hypothetical protein